MITTNISEKALISSDLEVSTGFISMNAHMFKILICDIYTDKILAVIRENMCNGWDSHIVAGTTDTPMQVTFPNEYNSWFEVRDFGTGLSEEFMRKCYVGLGVSNKQSNNNTVGGFGIGCKTSLSYSDIVSISSFLDGTESQYSFYLDQGIPALVKVMEKPSNEPNGLKVTVPVPESDIYRFQRTGKSFLKTFKTFANVQVMGMDWDEAKDALKVNTEGSGYKLVDNFNGAMGSVVMGGVAYNINNSYLKPLEDLKVISYNKSIIMEMDIGSLDIAASRETLQYTDKTIKGLEEAVTTIVAEVRNDIQKSFEDCKTFKEFVSLTAALVANTRNYNGGWTQPWCEWKGKTIASYTKTLEQDTRNYLSFSSGRGKEYFIKGTDKAIGITQDINCVVMYSDRKSANKMVAAKYAKTYNTRVILESSWKRIKFLKKLSPDLQVIKVTDIYDSLFPKKIKGKNSYTKVSGCFKVVQNGREEIKEMSKSQDGYFLIMERNSCTLNGRVYKSHEVVELANILNIKNLYLVRKSGFKLLSKNLKDFDKELLTIINKKLRKVSPKLYASIYLRSNVVMFMEDSISAIARAETLKDITENVLRKNRNFLNSGGDLKHHLYYDIQRLLNICDTLKLIPDYSWRVHKELLKIKLIKEGEDFAKNYPLVCRVFKYGISGVEKDVIKDLKDYVEYKHNKALQGK